MLRLFQNEKQTYQNHLISVSIPDKTPEVFKNQIVQPLFDTFDVT